MFLGIWAVVWCFMKDKGQVGAFAQASARSSAAVLGIALAVNIYGDAGMVPMMIMSAVPFFNVYSVLILSFSPQVDEEGHLLPASHGMEAVKKACINVAKNPLILGILAGLPFSLLRIQVPVMLDSALSSIGGTATPIALLVVGASFSGSETLLFAFLHVIIKFTNVVLWKMKRMSLREVAHAGVAIRSPFRTGYVIGT